MSLLRQRLQVSASGVQKLLVAEIDRLEEENGELKAISREFGNSQRRIGVPKEKLKRHTAFDVIPGPTKPACDGLKSACSRSRVAALMVSNDGRR